MGLEVKCNAIIARKPFTGTLHVDSKELSFKSKDIKWALALESKPKASVTDGWLIVPGAKFELGAAATKWVEKISNPPSRLTKLGLKPDTRIWVAGPATRDFLHECEENKIAVTQDLNAAGTALFFCETAADLASAPAPNLPLWLIYPKGAKTIKEAEVMAWAKQHNVGASKTLSFDDKRTGLRFGRKNS